MKQAIKFDLISFSVDFAKSVTAEDFVKEFSGMDHIYPELHGKAKSDKLKENYKILTGKKETENPGPEA